MSRTLARSPSGPDRLDLVVRALAALSRGAPALVLGPSGHAAAEVVRLAAARAGAAFGWHRATLGRAAATLAGPVLAARGLAVAGALPLEALCARVVHRLGGRRALGRFQSVAELPGLPTALAASLSELRLAGHSPEAVEPVDADLSRALAAYEAELAAGGLADRAAVFAAAAEAAATPACTHRWVGVPLFLADVPLAALLEQRFVAALAGRAPLVTATVPSADHRSRLALEAALGVAATDLPPAEAPPALRRLRERLFAGVAAPSVPAEASDLADAAGDAVVAIFSAPGEGQECVEIARRLLAEARRGVPFDRMAILLRAPAAYRARVEEALRRAGIPAWFARGTVRPDPAGRALLSLLACAAEDLSARRFAEYLSLGEVPDPADSDGAPPPAPAAADRWTPPDEELAPAAVAEALQVTEPDPEAPSPEVRAPRRWEHLLNDAAVIGGRDRWARRLDGHRASLELELAALERDAHPSAERVRRQLGDLTALRAWALPLVDALDALPRVAPWRDWLEALSSLAARAVRHPERVLSTLAELAPLGAVGPVDLAEVRLVLGRRLTELGLPPPARRYGRVFVGPVEAARGLAFDVVFAPGLAERVFPQKVGEDPLLRDDARVRLGGLPVNADRVAAERLALHLAVGAARRRVVVSFPRLDALAARARVPSFYAVEVVRATEGALPSLDELTRRAEVHVAARLGWPAPEDPADAIDDAEHDLALLGRVLTLPPEETRGAARYLMNVNPHLARALRRRFARVRPAWSAWDGMVSPGTEARAALAKHGLATRAWSATALQHYAACPYRFYLAAILRLAPREEASAAEELDPLHAGTLVHETQYAVLEELQQAGLLPLHPEHLDDAQSRLNRLLDETAAKWRDELAPSIARVWDDAVASLRADLREWLRRLTEETTWTPWRFELSFGLPRGRDRDEHSTPEPVTLDAGLKLHGAIDLVERDAEGRLRATDHKTGKVRAAPGDVIRGGAVLQPALYALALEKLFPGQRVAGGRLHYVSAAAGFASIEFPLDAVARESIELVAATLGEALTVGAFPAAPEERACDYCDYARLCGPTAERDAARKRQDDLVMLHTLRSRP